MIPRSTPPSELVQQARAAMGMSETAWGFLRRQAYLYGWAEARLHGLSTVQADAIVDAALSGFRALLGDWAAETGEPE